MQFTIYAENEETDQVTYQIPPVNVVFSAHDYQGPTWWLVTRLIDSLWSKASRC